MNRKNITIIAIILVLLLGLAGYFIYGRNKTPEKTTQTSQTPAKSSTSATNTTLAGLITLGQNLRCTFDTSGATGGSTKGTVYVSKGNVRGDFTTTSSTGKQEQMSIIRMGDTNYIWGSSLTTGIKMTLSLDKITNSPQASQYSSVTQKTNYNCMPWNVDASLFTPPANVKFTDMTSILPVSPTGTQTKTGTSNPCATITDAAAKTACENALKGSSY